jgi:hypothetical protein
MLVIREEQQEAMRAYMLEQYVDRTYEHFLTYFPRYCEIRTEPALRDLIRHGVDRAAAHEIVGERNVLLYTTLMLILGCDFDEDPQYPWAATILADESHEDESARADALYDAATDWLDRVAGEDHELMGAALMRLRTVDVDKVLAPEAGGSFEEKMSALLNRIYPSKGREIGAAAIVDLCGRGMETAREYGLEGERGGAVITGLMFILGTGCTADPQHPWISRILSRPPDRDDPPRADELFKAAIEHVKQWLQ